MNRMIMIGLFVLVSISAICQEKKKSVMMLDKPQKVKIVLPSNQQRFTNNLRKAGAGLVIGSLLSGLGAILRTNSESSSTTANILQIGGFAGIVYSGVVLQQASSDFERYSKEQSSQLKKQD